MCEVPNTQWARMGTTSLPIVRRFLCPTVEEAYRQDDDDENFKMSNNTHHELKNARSQNCLSNSNCEQFTSDTIMTMIVFLKLDDKLCTT